MIAAQYEIPLPADYDMQIIHRRVVERGSVMDDRAGLAAKAYLIRDVADGSPVNAYAPFYLWRDPAALAAFHWGGQGFSGIVRDFGRPAVRTWIGGGFTRGDAFAAVPQFALRRVRQLGPGVDLVETSSALSHGNNASSLGGEVHSRAWGIDPSTWQSVEFTLLTRGPDTAAAADETIFRVLHLSAPELQDLG
jgi:hypothetical protein